MPTRLHCLRNRLEENCVNSTCEHWIPPVEGDLLRRHPVCARAVSDLAHFLQGMTNSDIGWILGCDEWTVRKYEKRALVKLKKRVR